MLKALLVTLIAVLTVVLAVKVVYAVVLLALVIVSAVLRGVVLPILTLAYVLVVRPAFWVVGETIALPFRLAGVVLHPVVPAGAASGLVLGPVCRNHGCRCANPTGARFCRRCGAVMG